jgi:hypothetical protein
VQIDNKLERFVGAYNLSSTSGRASLVKLHYGDAGSVKTLQVLHALAEIINVFMVVVIIKIRWCVCHFHASLYIF